MKVKACRCHVSTSPENKLLPKHCSMTTTMISGSCSCLAVGVENKGARKITFKTLVHQSGDWKISQSTPFSRKSNSWNGQWLWHGHSISTLLFYAFIKLLNSHLNLFTYSPLFPEPRTSLITHAFDFLRVSPSYSTISHPISCHRHHEPTSGFINQNSEILVKICPTC